MLAVVNLRAVLGYADRSRLLDWWIGHRAAFVCITIIVVAYAMYLAPLLDPLVGIDELDRLMAIVPFNLGNSMRSTLPAVAGLQEPAWHPRLALGGGSLRPEIMGHQNYLLSAMVSALPISSVDVVGIFQLEKLAIFLVFCMGGVGYYAFVRAGLRLRHGTALIVGVVMVMSDGILARHPEVDWGYASAAVPWVLLAVTRARDANSLWGYALAGGATGILQGLHFTHPEVTLATLYFVVGFIVWDYMTSAKHPPGRTGRIRQLAAIPVFGLSCLIANYRAVGSFLEFSYDGNHVTSERLHDYGLHGPTVVAQNLLAPLGMQGSGPFPEPGVPYFYGLTVSFLVIFGVVALVRRQMVGSVPSTWASYALAAPMLLRDREHVHLEQHGDLVCIGLPRLPLHTGLRILHPVHACVMMLFAFGLDELLGVGNEAVGSIERSVVLKALAAFLVLSLALGPKVPGAELQLAQSLFAAVTILIACFVPMRRVARLCTVGVLISVTALMATRGSSLATAVGYHETVLKRSRVPRK